jgi:hypothetical protein
MKPIKINGKNHARGKTILADWNNNPDAYEKYFGMNKTAFAAILFGVAEVETKKTKHIKY